MLRPILLAVPLLLSAVPAFAAEDCLALAERDPPAALAGARQVLARAPKDVEARQCEAAALFAGGNEAEAAQRFEALGDDMTDAANAARFYAQAGMAATEANETDIASAAYGQAVAKTPQDMALRVDYGVALARSQRYWEALEQFEAVVQAGAADADLYLYRAAAHRRVGDMAAAAADVEAGLRLQSNHPGLLLERGAQHAEAGLLDMAAADWRTVRDGAPDSPEAAMARRNLELLPTEAQ